MLNFSDNIEMKKSLFILYKLCFLFFIFVGCTIIPSSSASWAERTLNQLSLREKIAQMMIYRMNMRLKDIPSIKWQQIMKLIENDGIGGIHLWYGDAATTLLMMNEMQESSKVPIIFDADIEYGLNQRFPMGTDLPPLMAIAATNDPQNAYEVGKIVAKESRSVGHAFNPKDGSLWFTDNQVDGMGDETPPGELNKACALGPKVWYGHPYTGGGEVRTNEYKGKTIPKEYADNYCKPQVEMIAHAADLGMMFYTGNMFPKKYHNAIFSAQHGSWNAVKPRGARVMVTYLDKKGNAKKTEPFAEGWMTEMGTYLGRPVDVQQYVDGSLLVSDDKAGVIYRITYNSPS